jgi:hypothetical protein
MGRQLLAGVVARKCLLVAQGGLAGARLWPKAVIS